MKNYKVTVIGAGNVGSLTAMRLLEANLCNVALIDVVDGLARGKSEDLMDAASILGYDKKIEGSTDFSLMKNSDIVVNTAGLARKPGMTREDLLLKNASIVKSVIEKVKQYAPDSIIVNVTNPLDAMTFLAYKTSGFKKEKVVGMAGLLDSSRMNLAISRLLKKPVSEANAVVLGTHGETMAPILSQSKVGASKLTEILSSQQQAEIVEKTKKRGAEIVSYLKTGSAFFSPSACVAKMVEIILKDAHEPITASCFLNGEYGINGIYLGVPATLGRNGIEKITKLDLTKEEMALLHKAADSIKKSINLLNP